MATVYGTNRTLIRTGTANTIEPEMMGARVRCVYDEYTAAALAGASVIELGLALPDEARVINWIIDADALATAYAIRFGTLEDDDEFLSQKTESGADRLALEADGVAGSLGFEIGTTSDHKQLAITYSGTSTATGTIRVALFYTTK